MSTDIGAVKGLIELQDDFTSRINLAAIALKGFSKENQESLKAVAGAAGLVTVALTAVAAATVALGRRGADINDLRNTIEQFTGGAREADEVMESLRRGTLATVDNFTLAERAAHLLSAGVRLTNEEFETLGSASFIMANRGLGTVEDQLKLVSEAMVTGRTRALAMKLGVIDVADAEESYAKSLGLTKDMLSDTAKAETHRIAVMDILNRAVKEAGVQTRDFGEQLVAARVFLTNWLDDLASAIAKSPVFAAGMEAIGKAVSEAFGNDKSESIKTIVGLVEDGAIIIVDFGLAAIEMARVVNVAWSAVKTVVLGVMTGISAFAETILTAIIAVSQAAEDLNIIPEGATEQLVEYRSALREVTVGLDEQTKEAAKGVVGHSEFDRTLDELGGTLLTVRDAMVEASEAAEREGEVLDIATENTRKLEAVQRQLAIAIKSRAADQAEMNKLEKKSLEESAKLWAQYAALRIKNSGTSADFERAQIEATFQAEVAKLNKLSPAYEEHYKALRAVADENLTAISMEWDSVKDKSLESLQQQAAAARETYNRMVSGSLTFTRDTLQEQLDKVRELEAAARGMGDTYQDSFERAAEAAAKVTKEAEEQKKAAEEALKANRLMGGSTAVNRANLAEGLGYRDTQGKFKRIPAEEAFKMAERGFSAEEIMLAWRSNMVDDWVPQGPRIPGFAEGGTVAIKVGERGPETVRVPLGSQVLPNGHKGAGGPITINIQVNGTAADVARKIKQLIMSDLESTRQFA